MGLRGLTGPARPLPDFPSYLLLWSAGHGGYMPSASARGWLRLTYACAVPLVRLGVSPNALTALGVLVCASAPLLVVAGVGWSLVAALMIVVSGLVDGLDGAVAVLAGRATRFGAVLDGLADRLGEVFYLLALWWLGAPGWLCVLGGGLAMLQEYMRARAGAAGMTEVGVVTVWERPIRIVVTAVALGAAGLAAVTAPGSVLGSGLAVDTAAVYAGAAAWVGFGVAGVIQLLCVVRRRLR